MEMYDELLTHLIKEALQEDIGPGDYSTLSCIPAFERGKAVLKIKEDGILAGMAVAQKIFSMKDASSVFTPYKNRWREYEKGGSSF